MTLKTILQVNVLFPSENKVPSMNVRIFRTARFQTHLNHYFV